MFFNLLVLTELLCCRFQEVAFVVPAREPPEYAASRSDTPILRKACDYCRSEYPQNDYTDHLTSVHPDRIFLCEECNNYIDKKDFVSHMTAHAMEYTSETMRKEIKRQIRTKREIKNENENTETSHNEPVPQNNDTRQQMRITLETTIRNIGGGEENGGNRNDFFDYSDTEYDFGPLPESVFEAIEDSRDSHTESVETSNTGASTSDDVLETSKAKILKQKILRRCAICGKEYTVSSSYFYHVKYSHMQIKEHACQTCGRKFATKGSLTQHASVHTEECPFECEECGKKFRSNASLYIHKQTHNGRKSHACTHCDASFRWKTHLARHMTRHSKEKKHVCTVCDRGFSVKSDLLRHARTHAAGKINCEKCGATFAQLRYLKVHMEKKHPNVE